MMQRHHDKTVKNIRETQDQISTFGDRVGVVVSQTYELKGLWSMLGRNILTKLDFLSSLGADARTLSENILSALLPISNMLGEVHCLLMSLQRPFEQHFVLEDATGRPLTIYLTNIPDWDAFDYFLQRRFKGRKGARRVQRRQYMLLERSSQTDIDRTAASWEDIFSSRQLVDMSLFCKEVNDKDKMASCPWCNTVSSSHSEAEVQW